MASCWLVTGAAGFIGSHVAEALLRRGDRVVAVDDFNPYYDPARKRRNLDAVRGMGGMDGALVFEELDIRDRAAMLRLATTYAPDGVVHLAAMGGVRASIERPDVYIAVNTGGTESLLSAAAAANVPHVVLASTSSVYGATTRIPFVEDDPCDTPLAPYAASKRAAEHLGYTFHSLYGTSVNVLRFFTVYGPRNRPDMMAYKILDSMFGGSEVPLYARGEMWRDWTFVGDIVEGVLGACDRPDGYRVLNLGRGEPVKLGDFVTRLEALTGKPARLADAPRPKTDVVKTWADVTRTAAALGYRPHTSIEAGTEALWAWYRDEVLPSREVAAHESRG